MSAKWSRVRPFLGSKWRRTVERVGLGIAVGTVFAAGAGAGALVVYTLHHRHVPPPPPPRPAASFSEVPAPLARDLAERFRPWLRFDSAERWRPLNVDRLLRETRDGRPAHAFCGPPAGAAVTCEPIASEAELIARVHAASTFGRSSYLDLGGRGIDDYHGTESCPAPRADCGTAPSSAIYFHVTRSNDRYYVDYWWFFRYNNFYRDHADLSCRSQDGIDAQICDEHEGDWEGVTVVTPPGDAKAADYVVLAAHKGTFRYAASELRMHPGTQRAEVFVARGSHASYPRACDDRPRCKQPPELAVDGLVTLPEGRFDGGAGWERNAERCGEDIATSCLLALPRADHDPLAWTFWPGRWGAGCQAACRGRTGVRSPESPGRQQRYTAPYCSTANGAPVCDTRALGCGDWLGPLVSVVACSPSRTASALAAPVAREAGALHVRVEGVDSSRETVPGVVQVLGDPLGPGSRVTVTGADRDAQVLLRARVHGRSYEARFDRLDLVPGRPARFTIDGSAPDRTVVTVRVAGGPARSASELRIATVTPTATLLRGRTRARRAPSRER